MDLAAHSSASCTDAANLPWCPLQVKFTQQNWHDRLTTILDDFPKVRQGSTQQCNCGNACTNCNVLRVSFTERRAPCGWWCRSMISILSTPIC